MIRNVVSHRMFAALVAAIVSVSISGAALAQGDGAYPDRPVRVVVPFPAGGATDIVGRLLAEKLQAAWGKPVYVENIVGAAGMTGTAQGVKSPPDGYTITTAVGNSTTLLASLRNRSKLPYDPLNDYEALALVTVFPNLLAVRPHIEAKTVQELIDLLRANPGKFTFASTGFGSSTHIAGEWFKVATKTDILHVPFTGSAPALTALLGGHVDIMFDTMPSILPSVQSGKLRALGIGTLERVASVPGVPAIAETLPGFDVAAWDGFVVPKGTPADIQKKIANAFLEAMKDPVIVEKFNRVGAIPYLKGPEDFRGFIQADYEKWRRVIAATGIKLDN
jgi:tripartite-type tricarboxylate transporter receptor subunit TctC